MDESGVLREKRSELGRGRCTYLPFKGGRPGFHTLPFKGRVRVGMGLYWLGPGPRGPHPPPGLPLEGGGESWCRREGGGEKLYRLEGRINTLLPALA
jgi:hypothetical protein